MSELRKWLGVLHPWVLFWALCALPLLLLGFLRASRNGL